MGFQKGMKVKDKMTGAIGTIIFYAYYTNALMPRDVAEHIVVDYGDNIIKRVNFDDFVVILNEDIRISFSWQDIQNIRPDWSKEECVIALDNARKGFQPAMRLYGLEVLDDVI